MKPDTPKFGNELVELIRMEKCIVKIWVNMLFLYLF